MSKLPGWSPITVSSAPREQIDRFHTYGYDSDKRVDVIDGHLMCVTPFGNKARLSKINLVANGTC